MKKRMKSLIAVLAVCCALGVSVACGGEEDVESGNAGVSASQPMDSDSGSSEVKDSGSSEVQDSGSSEETVEDKEIEGVTFTDREYTYDGQEKTLLVTGDLPDGVTASYQGNKGTEVGTYSASVTLSGEGYVTKTLNATLTINKAEIKAQIAFDSVTVEYDTQKHGIQIVGDIPAGTSVSYTYNNEKVDGVTEVGEYAVVATISGKNYQTKTLNATLTINKAEIKTQITFDNVTVEYDAQKHGIQIVGDIPAGTSVSYTYNNEKVDGVTEVGEYTVVATISGKNYQTKTLEAKLTIKSTEALLHCVNHDGTIYFQNNLDDNKLYKVDESGEIVKVNNDIAENFFSDGNTLYYYSTGLLSKNIKKITGDGKVSTVYSVKGEYLTSDGEYVYYAVNNILVNKDENGIWKYKLDGSEDTPVRLTSDKAAYLCVANDYIFYSNLSQDKKLYKLSVNGGTGVCVHEEAVEYIIEDNGVLYFNSKKTAKAIYKYNISSGTATKMTTDSGKYLAKVGNDIYYVNNDLLTSNIFGDGIYKVSALASGSLPGTKVISSENNGYSSLTSDGEYLYYYKLNDKHLYRYDPDDGTETDMMAGFTPPAETVTYAGGAVIAEYKGEIYYSDPTDESCLYKYNPQTKTRVKVLADSVAGVWFNGNYMYYSTFALTNYALFRMDMTTKEGVKISSDRCQDLIFEGDEIYYVRVKVGTNGFMKMNADGTGVTEVFAEENVYVTGVEKIGNTYYFVKNPAIGYKTLYTYTVGDTKATNLKLKAFEMVIVGEKIYYYDDTANALKRCDKNGENAETLVSNVDINDLCVNGTTVYYSTQAKTVGLYAYNTQTGANTKISDLVADGMRIIDGKLWFINTAVNYIETGGMDIPNHKGSVQGETIVYLGDGKLYCYDGVKVEKK